MNEPTEPDGYDDEGRRRPDESTAASESGRLLPVEDLPTGRPSIESDPHATTARPSPPSPDDATADHSAEPRPEEDVLSPGMVVRYFGDYEVQHELGRGGMGVVYRALQLSLNRPVAQKMIRGGGRADDVALRRFQNYERGRRVRGGGGSVAGAARRARPRGIRRPITRRSPGFRGVEILDREPDVDPLRALPEFQRLRLDPAFPVNPCAQ